MSMLDKITSSQIVMARAALGWSQTKLANEALVSIATLRRIENFSPEFPLVQSFRYTTLRKINQVLLKNNIILFWDDCDSFGVRVLAQK